MTSTAHDITSPGPPRVEEVSDGVFAYRVVEQRGTCTYRVAANRT